MRALTFHYLRVGDRVMRALGAGVRFPMVVVQIDDEHIYAADAMAIDEIWKFRRDNGCQVDFDLGWDGLRSTGSYLVHRGF